MDTVDSVGPKSTIVCADDVVQMRLWYEHVLRKAGYDVVCCESGEALLDLVNQRECSLVMLDLEMPGLSGLETLRRLRRSPHGQGLPIVLVSAHDRDDDIAAGFAAGADDYLTKPVRPAVILAKVCKLLRRRELSGAPVRDLAAGVLVNQRYAIQGRLGNGNNSTVYRAFDCQDGNRPVALKVIEMSGGNRGDNRIARQFMREVYEHSRLDHPNIVKLTDFGQVGGAYYIVMELLDGQPLSRIVASHGRLQDATVIVIARQLVDTLAYLAERQLIHRDLKPDNLVLTRGGIVKLLDFGLARRQTDETYAVKDELRGTPNYFAPEYIHGDPGLDVRTDVYALGVTLFYLASGELPIGGDNLVEIIDNHLKTPPRSLTEVRADALPRLAEIIGGMLIKDRDRRRPLDALRTQLTTLEAELGAAAVNG